jgi:hypothetical protein
MTNQTLLSNGQEPTQRRLNPSVESYSANGVVFRTASLSDDAELRATLRSGSMDSWVQLSLEREPSFFVGEGIVGESVAVIATEVRSPNSTVGMYTCAFLPVHVNGRPECVGYLGGLRVNKPYQHKLRIVKGGFASIPHVVTNRGTVPFWFTSVAADNSTARRLLEARLSGMPVYRFVGNVGTLVLSVQQGKSRSLLQRAEPQDVPALVDFYNRQSAAYQFSPVLTEEWLLGLSGRWGLRLQDFLLLKDGRSVRGCVAIWDQRTFKQVAIHGYRHPLNTLRVPYNWCTRLLRRVQLPETGQRLEQASLAFLAFDTQVQDLAIDALREALVKVREKSATIGICGLSSANALYSPLKAKLRAHTYLTRIDTVVWPGDLEPVLDGRPPQPEVATL